MESMAKNMYRLKCLFFVGCVRFRVQNESEAKNGFCCFFFSVSQAIVVVAAVDSIFSSSFPLHWKPNALNYSNAKIVRGLLLQLIHATFKYPVLNLYWYRCTCIRILVHGIDEVDFIFKMVKWFIGLKDDGEWIHFRSGMTKLIDIFDKWTCFGQGNCPFHKWSDYFVVCCCKRDKDHSYIYIYARIG